MSARSTATRLDFVSEFDAVFSNAALHWMRKPKLVIAGVARALRPRGRFVGELGGHGNVAAIATAIRAVGALRGGDPAVTAPWFFPDRRGIWPPPRRRRLHRQGDRARAAPDPAQDRHGRLAQDLRQVILRSISRAGALRGRGRGHRAVAALALRHARASGPPTTFGFASLPSAAPDAGSPHQCPNHGRGV